MKKLIIFTIAALTFVACNKKEVSLNGNYETVSYFLGSYEYEDYDIELTLLDGQMTFYSEGRDTTGVGSYTYNDTIIILNFGAQPYTYYYTYDGTTLVLFDIITTWTLTK